jgi:hypothetical protein
MLSMLAEDNKGFAEGIVRTIEQHILTVSTAAVCSLDMHGICMMLCSEQYC